jgi:hypothetical protein
MRLPNLRKPRTSTRLNAGRNHVRYDHKRRPTLIEIVCPKCGGCAAAKEASYERGRLASGDLSPTWNEAAFSVMCLQCMHRASGLKYQDLTEPFHQISVSGRTLWAWNADHLNMVQRVLMGQSIANHPYASFSTYIHRGWLQWRTKFLREIERHQKTHKLNVEWLRP